MPASTLDILNSDWESVEKTAKDLQECSALISAQFYQDGNEVQIHKNYASKETSLIFEIVSESSLKWYFSQYPMAKDEPEERIPYFVFNEKINGTSKLFKIVTANCYLDDRLIYDFFSEYLELNPEKFVYINESSWFGQKELLKLRKTIGYHKDWCYK